MAAAEAASGTGFTGLSGFVVDVVERLGAVGVGVLMVVETVFPPIPSELVLPLAGYLSGRGDLDLVTVLVASTVGSVAGALLLYTAGARLGRERSTALLARLPLVDRDDVEHAEAWFDRHGSASVFLGRLVPGVRSLVSLPAGAERMPLARFTLLTLAGSLLWNSVLVGAGALLGQQWQTVERYSDLLNYLVVGVLVLIVLVFVLRRLRTRRRTAAAREPVRPGR